jgi:hypothetical protein
LDALYDEHKLDLSKASAAIAAAEDAVRHVKGVRSETLVAELVQLRAEIRRLRLKSEEGDEDAEEEAESLGGVPATSRRRSIIVQDPSEEEKQMWMDEVQQQLKELCNKSVDAEDEMEELLSRQRQAEEREILLLHERAALQTQLEELQAQVEEANKQVAMTVKSGHEQALALERTQKECDTLRQDCQQLAQLLRNKSPKEKSATPTPLPPPAPPTAPVAPPVSPPAPASQRPVQHVQPPAACSAMEVEHAAGVFGLQAPAAQPHAGVRRPKENTAKTCLLAWSQADKLKALSSCTAASAASATVVHATPAIQEANGALGRGAHPARVASGGEMGVDGKKCARAEGGLDGAECVEGIDMDGLKNVQELREQLHKAQEELEEERKRNKGQDSGGEGGGEELEELRRRLDEERKKMMDLEEQLQKAQVNL